MTNKQLSDRIGKLEKRLAVQADIVTNMRTRLKGHADLITRLYARLNKLAPADLEIPKCYRPLLETFPDRKPKRKPVKLEVVPTKKRAAGGGS
jgi:uncharacterized coiled-coil protein SlyX